MKTVTWRLIVVTMLMFFSFQLVMAKPVELVLEKGPVPQINSDSNSSGLIAYPDPPSDPMVDVEGNGYYRELASWDFETGDLWTPKLRQGSNTPPAAYWQTSPWGAYSGNSWWCGVNAPTLNYNGYDNNWEQYLETPSLDLSGSASTMTFQFMMKAYLEGGAYHPHYDSWDAANVWYSTDGGATWAVLTGPSLAYNSSSNYAYGQNFGYYYDSGSGMVGTPVPGWMGNITGGNYVPISFNISSLIGETNVKLRFGFASDGSESAANYSAYTGMFIDDVLINDNNGTVYLQNNADGVAIGGDLIPIEQYDSAWELTETTANSETHSWHIPNDLNVRHMVQSPQFYLPNTSRPLYLSYNVWCDMPDFNSNGGALDDYYQILISINNGASWYALTDDWSTRPDHYGPSLDGWVYRDTGWDSATKKLDLSQYKGYNIKLAFRVLSDWDNDGGQGTGIYIDDVEVIEYEGFYDYEWEPTEYNWIELADDPEAQFLFFSANNHRAVVDMPNVHSFEFPFYDRIQTVIRIGASGTLYFNGNYMDFPYSLTDYSSIANVIAPLRTPLEFHSRNDAGVFVKNVDGVLVCEWFAAHIENEPTWPVVFQAQLFPDGAIEFHYQVVSPMLPEVSPLTIGLNNSNRTVATELWPDMDFLPFDETAVRFTPGVPSYGDLDLTVIDEETTLPVPNLELYIPRFSQYAYTDANGQVFFDYVPLHQGETVEIQLLTDYYVHDRFTVELQPDVTTEETMFVHALIRPIRNLNADNFSESEVTLWWDYPNVYYDMAGLELYQNDAWSWYTFNDPTIAQGCDFSGYALEGTFDIEEVSFYLINRERNWYDYSHQPDINVDIWDMNDPANPVHIYQTTHNPGNSYGWCSVPIDLYGLQDPNFAVTVTTPENSGYYAYNLFFDSTNDYMSDVIISDVYSPDQEINLGTMPGDPVMSVVVRYNGSVEPPVMPGPDSGQNNDLAGILESHDGYYRLGQSDIQPVEYVRRAPDISNSESGSDLDEYSGVVEKYYIYQDGVLVDSTTSNSFTVAGLNELTIYDFEITPLFQYDGQLIEGPVSPVITVSPVMPPEMPDGIDGLVVDNESIAGGDIHLSWVPPTLNIDGSIVDDISGFNLYLNGDFETPDYTLPVESLSLDIVAADRGYYNFYITAFDDAGHESQPFEWGYKMVGTPDDVIDFASDGAGFFNWNFEWGTPTAGPESSFSGEPNLWATNLSGYYENRTYYSIQTPPLYVDGPEAWVTFGSWYDFEYGYDGGFVAASTDNGETWEMVDLAQDGSLYNDPFWGAQFESPIGSMVPDGHGVITGYSGDAWNGTAEGWSFSGVTLTDYVGQDIILAFIAGTDVANALHTGWYIDDVGLYNVSFSPIGSIEGIVTDGSDNPLEDAIVTIGGRLAQTDANGLYSFTELLIGDYDVRAWKQGYNESISSFAVTEGNVTNADFTLTQPIMDIGDLTEITIEAFPGYTGTYNLNVMNIGDGPLWVRPDVAGSYSSTSTSGNDLSYSEGSGEAPDENPMSDDFLQVYDDEGKPHYIEHMSGITVDDEGGVMYLTDKNTKRIYIVNLYTKELIESIPQPSESSPNSKSGSVELNGSDLWASWHEYIPSVVLDTESDSVFVTHFIRITDFETGDYDVELLSSDMGWNGPVHFFEFYPDYSGMIFTGHNDDLGENAIAFTTPIFSQTQELLDPEINAIRQLPTHGARGLELSSDGNLWVASNNDLENSTSLLFEIDLPSMDITAEFMIPANRHTVGGLDILSDGNFILADSDFYYTFEAGFGHPFFSSHESRYQFGPGFDYDIVFDVCIPEDLMIGSVIELELILHNNGMPFVVEIPVYLNINEPIWTHDIPLNAGWNLSSINLLPQDTAVELQLPFMFGAEIDAGNLILIKDNEGNIFDPATGLNQIGPWNLLEAYKIKVNNPSSFTITGQMIYPGVSIDVFTGWNMVSYIPQDPMNIWVAVESILNQIVIVKDGYGNFFLPDYGYNGIGNMMPHLGYQVKVVDDATLVYPHDYPSVVEPSGITKATRHFISSLHGSGPSFSLLIVDSEIDGQPLSINDEIAVFDDQGRIISSAVWGESGKAGLPIWIDDPATEVDEGVEEGEAFFVKVWIAKDDISIPVNLELIAGDAETKNDGYRVASISGSVSSVIPSQFSLSQNYPNPFNPSTTIQYGLPENAFVELEIFNVLGQTVRTLIREDKLAGYHSIVWDGFDNSGKVVSSGTYFYRLRAGEFTQMLRMVVTK